MRRIGLIGGMSWESSLEYYRIINETIHEKLGGVHSAEILMYSFDFDEIETMQREMRALVTTIGHIVVLYRKGKKPEISLPS